MENINFLWRENYIDYLWATETTGKHYFFDSGYLVYREGVLSAYATDKEFKKTSNLLDYLIENPRAMREIEGSFIKMKRKIDTFHNLFPSSKISKVSGASIFNLYISLINLYGEYIKLYRLTEPHLVKNIEKKAKKIVSEVNSSKKADIILAEILSSKEKKLKKYKLLRHKNIFILIESISKTRFKAKKITDVLNDDVEILLKETSRRTNYAVSQISSMSLGELKKVLTKNASIDTYKLNLRNKIFGIKIFIKKRKVFIQDISIGKINIIEKAEHNKGKKISGDIVYPGKVRGTARLIPPLFGENNYKRYLSSLKKGDIIVAPMTTPDLAISFSRISGVITDEGGLMSHAALISREYKKPCVVGTKIATKFLKEGDRILLDADNGIIKKI